jgi:hypothetical protein
MGRKLYELDGNRKAQRAIVVLGETIQFGARTIECEAIINNKA